MLKHLLTFLLTSLLFIGAGVAPTPPLPILAVRAIQLIDGDGHLVNICSTSSINQARHYWLTAAHCVTLDGHARYIDGDEVQAVMRDVIHDIAILRTFRAVAPSLKLATRAPEFEEKVKVVGHPFGILDPIITHGIVSHPAAQLYVEHGATRFMMVSALIAPGNSGSPVLNSRNEIVSVVQGGFARTFSVSGGVPYQILTTYRSYWHDR